MLPDYIVQGFGRVAFLIWGGDDRYVLELVYCEICASVVAQTWDVGVRG